MPSAVYQRIRQLHESPRVVDAAVTRPGNAVLWSLVLLLLAASGWYRYLPLVPLMVLCQELPAQRARIMSAGGVVCLLGPRLLDLGVVRPTAMAVVAVAILGALFLAFRAARSYARLPRIVRSHPQVALHALLWSVAAPAVAFREGLGIGTPDAPTAALAALLLCAFLVWRVGFLLTSGRRGSLRDTGFATHLLYLLPAYGGSHTPYGKGWDYLAAKQAGSRAALARSQLAGLKLILLACIWSALLRALGPEGAPVADLPGVRAGLACLPGSAGAGLATLWLAVLVDMIRATLDLAVRGHLIIGCLRLFGFNVFRNTYKPLLAPSIVAFWNRYYYYFKELLVDFFFFPTYLALFKGRPKLRMFAATLAAGTLGNFYYHVLRSLDELLQHGVAALLPRFASYLFYASLLGIGVFVSMLREQQRRGRTEPVRSPALRRLVSARRIAGVWIFFALIRIWDEPSHTFLENSARFLALFGASLAGVPGRD